MPTRDPEGSVGRESCLTGAEWRLKEANCLCSWKTLQAAGAGGDAFVHLTLLCPLVSCPPLAGPSQKSEARGGERGNHSFSALGTEQVEMGGEGKIPRARGRCGNIFKSL